MKISMFPKGELDAIVVARTLSVPDWIRQMSTLPIEGVELYSEMFSDPGLDASEVTDVLAATGLEMPMLCASPDFTHPDPSTRSAEFDKQVRMMQTARAIGGPGVTCRVLSGQRHPGVGVDEGIERAASNINALLPIARELDVVLGLENHYKDGYWEYPEFAQHREVFHALLDRIEERVYFGVQFDPSNATVARDDPVDFLRGVIDRVVTMQASDRALAPGATLEDLSASDGGPGYSALLKHGVVGQGLNDYPTIFAILVEAGYDGWISIEDGVNGFDDMARSVDFLVDARQRYFHGSREVSVRSHIAAKKEAAHHPTGVAR